MRRTALVAMVGLMAAALIPLSSQAGETAGVLPSWWKPGIPSTVIPGELDAVDPVVLETETKTLLLAAESRGTDARAVLLSRSGDGGQTWASPREIARATQGNRITAGAAGTLPNECLVLALHEWKETPGQVTHMREEPAGVHHYSWSGFRRQSALRVLVSKDDGETWKPATTNMDWGPMEASAMGKVFAADGAAWFPVYGPSDRNEMDAALGGVGLMRSDDDGNTWRFSHWIARADKDHGIGYGPGDVTVLPDGRWLGLLQGNFPMQRQFHGETKQHPLFYVRSHDMGETWSDPIFWATHPGTRYEGLPDGPLGDLRETGIAVLDDTNWMGIYRESRGTPAPENDAQGPFSMPFLCLARSADDGQSWRSSFGFLGVEPDIEVLPGGAVMVAYRDDNLASVWLSYSRGATWQIQHDPAELPWHTGAAESHGQWPPGGEPIIRMIDEDTVAVICDTGMIPSGKLLPADYKLSKEYQGRVQVRYFRRVPILAGGAEAGRN